MTQSGDLFVNRDCPLCGYTSHTVAMEVQETFSYRHLPDHISFNIVNCNECGLLFVNPRLCKSLIDILYAEDLYNSWGKNWNYRPKVALRYDIYHHNIEERQKAYEHFCDRLKHCVITGSVFELGIGFGYLLNTMRKRGFEVHGIDISRETTRFAIEKFDFDNVQCGDFLTLDFGPKQYDLIVLWHVFEHLYHPNQALAKCSEMLKPGGTIMITTPFHEVYTEEKINPVEHLYYLQQSYVQLFLKKHFSKDTWIDNPYVFARKAGSATV